MDHSPSFSSNDIPVMNSVSIIRFFQILCCMIALFCFSGCAVLFRNSDENYREPTWGFRSVRMATDELEYVWIHNRLPLNGSYVGIRWLEKPLATLQYAIELPICVVVDTILLPHDLYEAWALPGMTLMRCVSFKNYDLLKRRLKAGHDPNDSEGFPYTPLEKAIMLSDIESVQLLLQYGATATERTFEICHILYETNEDTRKKQQLYKELAKTLNFSTDSKYIEKIKKIEKLLLESQNKREEH